MRNLILMATPVDYTEMGAMVALLRDGRLNPDELVDETGNVPADALYSGFYMLAPTTEVAQKATLLENLWNDEFVEGFQAMATWSRDHVPFPGAAFRQLVELLVRQNILMTGSIPLGDRQVDLANAQGNVLNAMAERDNVVPPPAVEPVMTLVGDPARREELRLPGGHVTFGTGRSRVQAHHAEADRLDHRPQRRRPERGAAWRFDRSRPAMARRSSASLSSIPESDRTFLKEDVGDPHVVEHWVRPGAGRADRSRRRRGRRLGGRRAAHRLVEPRRRGPARRRSRATEDAGSGASLARQAVLDSVDMELRKLVVEVIADQASLIAMFRSLGFEPEALLIDHVRDRSGEMRDLIVLANSVDEQFAAMATAGVADQLQ